MKTLGMWILLVLCLALVGYVAQLAIINAPRKVDAGAFAIYPWQQGVYRGYWILIATVGAGMLVIPCIKGIARVIKGLRIRGWKAAAKEAKRAAAEEAKQGGQQKDE